MADVTLDKVQYLAFEGGGGKGVAYLGAVRALESLLNEKNGTHGKPLFDRNMPWAERQLLGISGSSAGAITAFMLALGMTYEEMNGEFEKIKSKEKDKIKISGVETDISEFELFFEDPNISELRSIEDEKDKFEIETSKIDTYLQLAKLPGLHGLLKLIISKVLAMSVKEKEDLESILMRKIFFNKSINKAPSFLDSFLQSARGSAGQVAMVSSDDNATETLKYFASLIVSLGVFPGFTVRQFFSDLLKDKLITGNTSIPQDTDPKKITFYHFWAATGVDLFITGVNVSRQRPMYFSVWHTPDFPVIEAIQISMNIPILFKPIYINSKVHGGAEDEYNQKYHGLWVDGGMLNNYPIHAFDVLENHPPDPSLIDFPVATIFPENDTTISVGKGFDESISERKIRDGVLGFRLTDKTLKEQAELRDDISPKDYTLKRYFGELLNTFMYPSEEFQIRDKSDRDKTIVLYTEEIKITDFSNIPLDIKRKTKVKKYVKNNPIPRVEQLSEMKKRVIDNADNAVRSYFINKDGKLKE
jgi:NTE family protein